MKKRSRTLLYTLGVLLLLFFAAKLYFKVDTSNTIAIQPLGRYDKALTDTIQMAIERYYGFNTVVLPRQQMKKAHFTEVRSPRYRADSLIRYLKRTRPDSIDYVLGFTNHDISTTKRDRLGNIKKPEWKYCDFGIFGLGFCPGRSAVLSNYRLGSSKPGLEVERCKKIALHELGHNLGLPHCPSENCFMRDAAESIKTIDNVEVNLCDKCKFILGMKR